MTLDTLTRRLQRPLDRLGARLDLTAQVCVGVFSIVFLILALLFAARRLMWYDELISFYMSRLPSLTTVWTALKAGLDLNPPFFYVATRWSFALLGQNELALRLPRILGFLIMGLCLFRFVTRRYGPVTGLVAMVFPLVTSARDYSWEGRAYGMVLGAAALALVAWQDAADGRRRRLALPLLSVSLAAALLTHCYAVLVLFPLAVGEAVRAWRARRLDWAVWAALAVPAFAVITYLPLLGASRQAVLANALFDATWTRIPRSLLGLLRPALLPLLLSVSVVAAFGRRAPGEPGNRSCQPGLAAHEIGAALAFLCLPVLAFLVSRFTHVFFSRYVLSAVIGMAVLFAAFVHKRTTGLPVIGFAAALLLFGYFVAKWGVDYRALPRSPAIEVTKFGQPIQLDAVEPHLPLVTASGLQFLQLDHYGSPALAARLVYLRDPRTAIDLTGTDVFDSGLPIERQWFPIRAGLEDYHAFTTRNRRFLLIGDPQFTLDWLHRKLVRDGARFEFLGTQNGDPVFEVEIGPQPRG